MKVFFLLLASFATASGQEYYSDEHSEMSDNIQRKQFDFQSIFDQVVGEIKNALSGMLQGEASRRTLLKKGQRKLFKKLKI